MNFDLPPSFVNRVEKQLGSSSVDFLNSLAAPPPVSVRLNPAKAGSCQLQLVDRVPWCQSGYYLNQRPVFTLDPLFHGGCYYPQEASSMIIDWLLREVVGTPGHFRVLDLCAAPGGKATLLASWLNGEGLLVANEVIRNRASVLRENLLKWGYPNCVVTRSPTTDFARLGSFFDVILVDAPCSGEGMFRKEKQAIEHWSEASTASCAIRQRQILMDTWPALKPGGYLIYSTCTFNPAENQDNAAWFAKWAGAGVMSLNPPGDWDIELIPVGNGQAMALWPHRVKGEGFFAAMLQKPGLGQAEPPAKKYSSPRLTAEIPAGAGNLLCSTRDWIYCKSREEWLAFPRGVATEMLQLMEKMEVIHSGVPLGQMVKNNWLPAPGIAFSNEFDSERFPSLEVERDEALSFLKGEPLKCRDNDKGYLLIKFGGVGLGFVKNIGTRMNNLFPDGWRIRMAVAGKTSRSGGNH